MSAIDIVRAVLAGDLEGAAAECEMELSARSQTVVDQGTSYVMDSIGDDINGTSPAHDEF